MLKKRFTSLFLALAMVLGLSGQALAKDDNGDSSSLVFESVQSIDNGHAYIAISDEESIAVLTDEEKGVVGVGITYVDHPEDTYHLEFPYTFGESFDPEDTANWDAMIAYTKDHIEQASVNTAIINDAPQAFSVTANDKYAAAKADIEQQFSTLMGGNKKDRIYYSTTYQGLSFKIYTSQRLDVSEKVFTIRNGLKLVDLVSKIGAFIALAGSLPVSAVTASALLNVGEISTALNLISSGLNQIIPDSELVVYLCRALIPHSTRINNMNYIYNCVYEFIDYVGYYNAEEYGATAYIDTDSRTLTYPDGEDYYYANLDQIKDAYDLHKKIGDKP